MIHSFLAPTFIIGILCYFVYKIFALYARRRERLLFIEKLSEISLPNRFPAADLPEWSPADNSRFIALRIALTLCGMGLGLLIGYLLPSHDGNYSELLCTACMLFFGGLGTLAAFILEYKVFSGSGRRYPTDPERKA